MPDTAPLLDRFMREPEIEECSGLSRTTRWRMARRGEFPRMCQISPNAKGLLESKYLTWQAERAAEGGEVEVEVDDSTEPEAA